MYVFQVAEGLYSLGKGGLTARARLTFGVGLSLRDLEEGLSSARLHCSAKGQFRNESCE